MFHFLDVNSINVFIGAILLTLSVVMFMIPIPRNERWRNFRIGRSTLAVAYIVLGLLMIVNGLVDDSLSDGNSDALSGMITLIVAFFQALLYTRICVLFLKPRSFAGVQYRILLVAFLLFSCGLAASYAVDYSLFTYIFYIGICLYTLLLVYCSFIFTKNFNETLKHLEYVYDEDMHYRLLWVKRCFYSALLVGIMAWFMAVFHSSTTLNVLGIFVYTIYYLCMVGYYMRYVSNYGFILKSDVGEWANNQDIDHSNEVLAKPLHSNDKQDAQTAKLHKQLADRLNKYVELKKYRDNSKTIDDIVEELDTTRPVLNEYMTRNYGVNFRTWRNRLRIEEAKRLLIDSQIPVSEIYNSVGYTDRSNFHRQFTSIVGSTPMQYRNKYKK